MPAPQSSIITSQGSVMNAPTTAPDISEACARANDEGSYNEAFLDNIRMERTRAADACDNYARASNQALQRMEACDSALSAFQSLQDQPVPKRG